MDMQTGPVIGAGAGEPNPGPKVPSGFVVRPQTSEPNGVTCDDVSGLRKRGRRVLGGAIVEDRVFGADAPERQVAMDAKRRISASPGLGRNARRCCPEELWRNRDRFPRAREELIHRHMAFARAIALRFRNQRDTVEDVIQVSYLGLVNAVDRFDLEREVPFEAFAAPTIRGELLRHMRDNFLPVHVSRGLQVLVRRVEQANEELAAGLKRAPDVDEVAAFLGEDREVVREALWVKGSSAPISLDRTESDDRAGGEPFGDIDRGFERAEARVFLQRAIGVLTPDERDALSLRFAGDLSQTEIAKRLGVSQMTISRLQRRGLERLRCELEAVGDHHLD
jgi:RNA polymerase sigma-B factor